ncbi:MAG: hypothetical protein NVS2B7_31960 [Herpetosiphon sp.]
MESQLPDYIIAEALLRTVRAVPGVADVYGGPLGEIATYGRGSRVPGVRVWHESAGLRVEVHVIALYMSAVVLPTLADTIRSRLQQQLQELAVTTRGGIDVIVADLRFA